MSRLKNDLALVRGKTVQLPQMTFRILTWGSSTVRQNSFNRRMDADLYFEK